MQTEELGIKKMKLASKWLTAYAQGAGDSRGALDQRWEFTLGGQPLAPNQVFAEDGMLPALLWAANSLYAEIFSRGFGLGFVEQDTRVALCGALATFERHDAPISHILLFSKKVVDSYALLNANPKNEFVLDALYMDWDSAKQMGKVPGVASRGIAMDAAKG